MADAQRSGARARVARHEPHRDRRIASGAGREPERALALVPALVAGRGHHLLDVEIGGEIAGEDEVDLVDALVGHLDAELRRSSLVEDPVVLDRPSSLGELLAAEPAGTGEAERGGADEEQEAGPADPLEAVA